ncbi:hypothetical protein HNQ77_004386 [Silvibacterium bohemicum]|uniref:Uncharacterized protein n=1 Tax=Silvibacterium bohemicum TaxID=1577686 RepID=A0A841K802_9BACT|nr:hypothetical protein [Silvibacterium bohemicum]MBB6146414.1 hypothetical protein [Silvibacterium bohemicum]
MEADWAAEIGSELPEIDASWDGFIDLRGTTEVFEDAVQAIPEAVRYPAMARALVALNSEGTRLFTSKSDVWNVAAGEIDPYEFAAMPGDAVCGVASYIDCIEIDKARFESFEWNERQAQQIVAELRGIALDNGRVDLVIRAARAGGREGYGITFYAAGCGGNAAAALPAWERVLELAVLATIRTIEKDGDRSTPSAHSGE